MSQSSLSEPPRAPAVWWREYQLLIVLLFAVVVLCLRLKALPLYGEETRRALIAREMVETGDWLVPSVQRVFLPSRPPLQNWLIAIAGYGFGSIDIWAARLPSILSTLFSAVIVYGYLRLQNSPLGSLAGAVSFLTMQLVMEFGRSAETEAVFTIFVAASMLLWHWGWIQKWPAWKMWSIGYGCAALGILTKGLQAPVYFVGSTILFLLATGNWRAIVTRAHFVGILVFCLVFGAWQGPFTWQRGISDSWNIYFADVAGRFIDRRWTLFLTHLVVYPVELLLVRLMPWSILLFAFGQRRIRARLGQRVETVLFLTVCILLSFSFVWFPPGSKARYFMPLFPLFAALVGIAVDCIAAETREAGPVGLWTKFVQIAVWVMAITGVVMLAVSLILPSSLISLSLPAALGMMLGCIGFAYATQQSLKSSSDRGIARGLLSIAVFLVLLHVGVVMTVQQRRCVDIEGQVKELKSRLPANTRLVSLGLTHHAFAFFYREPIRLIPMPLTQLPEDVDYFCLHTYENAKPELPFDWSQIAVVLCDRFKFEPVIRDRVIVGRSGTGHQRESDDAFSSGK